MVSHKVVWRSPDSPSGYATDGGFPLQIDALSQLFEATTVLVPGSRRGPRPGERPLTGKGLRIVPLTEPPGRGVGRKLAFPFWLVRHLPTLRRELASTDAVHAPIPGDVGTIGMIGAVLAKKPLFVRHCGNWAVRRTAAEWAWRAAMERLAGGRNVMMATGGGLTAPSSRNPAIQWIFSTSMSADDLRNGRARPAPPAGRARLIIAGRQEFAKGTGAAIESLPFVLESFPETTLDVVGGGSALPRFKALAESLGVGARVRFHGPVSHRRVLELFREADVFCYPTAASEGFPKVVLEAMASGLPVVTTRVSVLPLLVTPDCGLLVDDVGARPLAAAIRTCLIDPERYRSMSATAWERAQQYSLEHWRDTIGRSLSAAWGPLSPDRPASGL